MSEINTKISVLKENFQSSITKKKIISIVSIALIISFMALIFEAEAPQDYVFTFGAFILTVNLIPTIINKNSLIVRWTSIPTAIVVLSFCIAFITLDYYLSAFANFINFLAWCFISIFRGPKLED